MPKEFRALLADRPDPTQMLRRRGALPGLGRDPQARRQLAATATPPGRRSPRSPTSAAAASCARSARDIRRDFAALNRLSSPRAAPRPREVQPTLAEVYSAPVLAALGADGVREFAERYAGRTEVAQQVKVLDFEGVFVSGRRALAQVVYRLSLRAPSGHFVARAPPTWTVTLAREGGRWRFVQGLET